MLRGHPVTSSPRQVFPVSSAPRQELAVTPVSTLEAATVRLCGDSGDGMQLAGAQLARVSARMGNAVCSLPDYPAEIRAPAGTLAGVSGFQVHFSSHALRSEEHTSEIQLLRHVVCCIML